MLAVFGGSLIAVPAINKLKGLGYKVLVVDGNIDCPGRSVADYFVHQDFSDIQATQDALRPHHLKGIMPLNDFSIGAAAAVAREHGLPGWGEYTETCLRSKIEMKKAWINAGLSTARAIYGSVREILDGQIQDWDFWPCVVKPSFSGGGSRGVFIANNWQEIRNQLAKVGEKYLDRKLVIEEFIEGSEHTLEVVVFRGNSTLLSISDKQNYAGSHTVVQNLYFPGPVGSKYRDCLEPLVVAAARALRADSGALHFEVILRSDEPYLLEVGGRPGGGLNFHPICEISTGFNYPAILASILTGNSPDLTRGPNKCLAWKYFPVGSGIIKSIDGLEELKSQPDLIDAFIYEKVGSHRFEQEELKSQPDLIDAFIYEKVGSHRFELNDDLSRPGYVLVEGSTISEANERADHYINTVKFNVNP
jgi:biotin carboxylase